MTVSWEERAEDAARRYADGERRLPSEPDERQRQLTRMGNAAWAAGLSLLMVGRVEEARSWLLRAADTYRRSWEHAPPESWGRPIGALKCRLIAGDRDGAREDARWALEAGAAGSGSPIGRYAAALAALVLGDATAAGALAASLQGREDFPAAVADALAALAVGDGRAYEDALWALAVDFESRAEYLEDVPVADTVLALQALARERGVVVELSSPLLPGSYA
ncbi:MAG: hypothetical protein NZL88_04345 [Gaiellaceae bacterium]|nr:hypothetical protein [Gaiellaceae bacterium]